MFGCQRCCNGSAITSLSKLPISLHVRVPVKDCPFFFQPQSGQVGQNSARPEGIGVRKCKTLSFAWPSSHCRYTATLVNGFCPELADAGFDSTFAIYPICETRKTHEITESFRNAIRIVSVCYVIVAGGVWAGLIHVGVTPQRIVSQTDIGCFGATG